MILSIDVVDFYLSLINHFYRLNQLFPEYRNKLKEFKNNCIIGSNLLDMELNIGYLNHIKDNDPKFFNSVINNI